MINQTLEDNMFKLNERIKFKNSSNDILTIGELLVDMISEDYDDDLQCKTYNKFFGGSPANIAMNTKKLGISSIIVSSVGKDGLGKFLISKLKEFNIDTKYVQQVDYSTSMVLVTKSKAKPIPIFYREADFQLESTLDLHDAIKNSKLVHFSCWPISRMPSRLTIEEVIKVARENDVILCFDPNYHPSIWQRGEDGVEYVKSIISQIDILKPSEDDAERLFGEDSPENQLDKFLELGAKLVIMTLGKAGAIVSNGIETIKFNTFATDVVDTTGAGDAFWSGFYAAIIKGYTIKEALNLGFAVSAYKLKYLGAVVPLPKLEEIKKMYSL
jgi:sugar/nucleoside kinase (ribokinase family)